MIEVIQELWNGHGELLRVNLGDNSLIVKLIKSAEKAHHPHGWNSPTGELRKKTSYEVETHWYKEFHKGAKGARVANYNSSGVLDKQLRYLILEDLKDSSFYPKKRISWIEVEMCLKWLANFHRHYLNVEPTKLWTSGTYWHLDTRAEELEALTDMKLKKAAPLIDKKLNDASFQTIVHGDAKLANFLFSKTSAAAVDFQYVGGGVGVKDVAYFLSSIYEEDELENLETRCLDTYFSYLNLPEVEKQWRSLYPYAWCDFYRFLKGWSPGHWKIHSYSEKMKEKVLQCL